MDPKGPYVPFQFEMTQQMFQLVNCYFLLHIPLEHIKLDLETCYKHNAHLLVFFLVVHNQ